MLLVLPKQAYVGIILFAGFFETWAAAVLCDNNSGGDYSSCGGYIGWAVAVGAISTFICLIMSICFCACASTADQAHPVISIFLFVLWLCGIIWPTFESPFTTACSTANGYFACWICFMASFSYMLSSVPQLNSCYQTAANSVGGHELAPLLLFSCVEIAQASFVCCSNIAVWAIICGVVSAVLCLCLMLISSMASVAKFCYMFLAILWFAAVATLTYTYDGHAYLGMWSGAGNGFFSTWGAFFCAFIMMYVSWTGGATSFQMQDTKVHLAVIMVASFFELWAASTLCFQSNYSCNNQTAWALACGCISFFICVIMTVLYCANPGMAESGNKFVALIMLLLWTAGVGVLTFNSPFTSLCAHANGYCGSWICFISSFYWCYSAFPQLRGAADSAASFGGMVLGPLFAASVVVMAQTSVGWGNGSSNMLWWALICSIVSAVFVLFLMLVGACKAFTKYIAIFLTLLWFAAICTLTYTYRDSNGGYTGPYTAAGNGFFGCWIAFFCSFLLVYTEFFGGSAFGASTIGGGSTSGHSSNLGGTHTVTTKTTTTRTTIHQTRV